ncbi:MAG TPA: hypothetical protein DCE78_01465 [Bacteroidetes bacterium]|nr:hypothetical protein [Bacteroidota bacterium]
MKCKRGEKGIFIFESNSPIKLNRWLRSNSYLINNFEHINLIHSFNRVKLFCGIKTILLEYQGLISD